MWSTFLHVFLSLTQYLFPTENLLTQLYASICLHYLEVNKHFTDSNNEHERTSNYFHTHSTHYKRICICSFEIHLHFLIIDFVVPVPQVSVNILPIKLFLLFLWYDSINKECSQVFSLSYSILPDNYWNYVLIMVICTILSCRKYCFL